MGRSKRTRRRAVRRPRRAVPARRRLRRATSGWPGPASSSSPRLATSPTVVSRSGDSRATAGTSLAPRRVRPARSVSSLVVRRTGTRTIGAMLRGTLLAESLRVGHDLRVADLKVTRIGRHDVSQSTVPPSIRPSSRTRAAADRRRPSPASGPSSSSRRPTSEPASSPMRSPPPWSRNSAGTPTSPSAMTASSCSRGGSSIPDRRRGRRRGGRVRARRRHPAQTSGRLGRVTTSAPDATLRPLTCSNFPFWKVELRFPTWKVNRTARPPRKPRRR